MGKLIFFRWVDNDLKSGDLEKHSSLLKSSLPARTMCGWLVLLLSRSWDSMKDTTVGWFRSGSFQF